MFAEEQPALGPLPLEPFRYYRFGERTVHLDGCVEVEAAYYGAPPGWIGQRVQVQWNDLHVRLLDPKTGQLLREHLRARARLASHRTTTTGPRARRRPTLALLGARRTRRRRTSARVCAQIHAARRRAAACAGSSASSRSPRSTAPPSSTTPRRPRSSSACRPTASSAATSSAGRPCPLTLRQVDPLIRQLTLYRDLIDRKTGDPT